MRKLRIVTNYTRVATVGIEVSMVPQWRLAPEAG
jgi:hypothetical protein